LQPCQRLCFLLRLLRLRCGFLGSPLLLLQPPLFLPLCFCGLFLGREDGPAVWCDCAWQLLRGVLQEQVRKLYLLLGPALDALGS
jgi:hypothetical protein